MKRGEERDAERGEKKTEEEEERRDKRMRERDENVKLNKKTIIYRSFLKCV